MMGTGNPLLRLALRLVLLLTAASAFGCASAPPSSSGTWTHTADIVAPPTAAPKLAVSPAPRAPRSDRDKEPFGQLRIPGQVNADESPPHFAAEGLYVHFKTSVSDVMGDLDGTTAIVDDPDPTMTNQLLFLPDIEATEGFGLEASYRWIFWELAFGYSHYDYDADFSGVRMDVRMEYLDLNFKRYFLVRSPLQPYLVGGIGWSEADIDNASVQLVPLRVKRGKLREGVNYNLGAGAALYVGPWISVYAQAMYRFGEFEAVTGGFGKSLTDGEIDSDAWEIATGVAFRIVPPRN